MRDLFVLSKVVLGLDEAFYEKLKTFILILNVLITAGFQPFIVFLALGNSGVDILFIKSALQVLK